MTVLPSDLRNKLERAIIEARNVAEAGARAALEALAVHHHEPYPHQTPDGRALRNRLRAHARQLGDKRDPKTGTQSINRLVHECAYEHWHRMLFARFLAENDLLIEPSMGVAISLQECEELAKEAMTDLWAYASRCAQQMLPQIFRPDDPLLQVTLAREHQVRLEQLLAGLDPKVFKGDDSLGWVYQFWQSKRKEEVNASGNKIGADELPSVTQLFTEDYMVDFLLDNTLGAWHAGKVLAANPKLAESAKSEDELRKAMALPGVPWNYLRFIRQTSPSPLEGEGQGEGETGDPWRPAAGTFDGWPKTARELKCLDPCMGSGHFVVAMFERLIALRMAEEKLDEPTAVAAVIRDNLFGLEIDLRCTQIAAFNLALVAWRRVGHSVLPTMNLACSGLAPNSPEADWLKIAGDKQKLQRGMTRLYQLFQQAAVLGSLINPRAGGGDLLVASFHELQPLLEKALAQEAKDDTTHEMAVTAHGLVKAAEILASQFTLVATNVPYLGRGKQDDALKGYCERVHSEAKTDLATCFVERCLDFCAVGGSSSLVTPQNWLFLGSYKSLREGFLRTIQMDFVVRLGPKAFQTPMWDFNVMLIGCTRLKPTATHTMLGLDAAQETSPSEKLTKIRDSSVIRLGQIAQLNNPDAAIIFGTAGGNLNRLAEYADVFQGVSTTDMPRFVARFWEIASITDNWEVFHMAPSFTGFSGLCGVLKWERGLGELANIGTAQKGLKAKGKLGVGVAVTGKLHRSAFLGTRFDGTFAAIVPRNPRHLLAIYCCVISDDFLDSVRDIDQALSVTEASFGKVPFDFTHWQKVAAEKYPHGLPKPFSSDPTQWLFNGHPKGSGQPLQVSVARLLDYQWPRQTSSSFPGCPALGPDSLQVFADADGIVCIPSVRGEEPAADLLRKLLAAAYGKDWKPSTELELIQATGSNVSDLDEWLRNDFFAQHCDLFHQRPFVWHIWDGRKRDGFHALVNYHKLAEGAGKGHQLLESLTYAYLGDWITRQRDGVQRGEGGAEDRLVAALELQKRLIAILKGEPPLDIFVRWKPLHEQAMGWEPDINDGVRLNIRPFLAWDLPNGRAGAGILRWKPNIKWEKDRGKEPHRSKDDFPWFWGWNGKTIDFMDGEEFTGDRFNDCHYTVDSKRTARKAKEGVHKG